MSEHVPYLVQPFFVLQVELQQITNKMIQEGVSNYYRNNESSRFMDTVQKKVSISSDEDKHKLQ